MDYLNSTPPIEPFDHQAERQARERRRFEEERESTTFEYNDHEYTINPDLRIYLQEISLNKHVPRSSISSIRRALQDEGIVTFEQLQSLSYRDLEMLDGITTKNALRMVKANFIYLTRGRLIESFGRKKPSTNAFKYLHTEIPELNEVMFDGIGKGFRSNSLIHMWGVPQTGKSQFCYDLAVRCMLPEERGGWNQGVLFISTDNSFSMAHIMRVAQYWGLAEEELDTKLQLMNPEAVITAQNLQMAIQSPETQQALVDKNIGMIIIDSFFAPILQTYPNVHGANLSRYDERNILLIECLNKLKGYARDYNMLVVLTNITKYNRGGFGHAISYIPYSRNLMAHFADLDITLKKQRSIGQVMASKIETRSVQLNHCAWLPNFEVKFALTPVGICNTDHAKEIIRTAMELDLSAEEYYNHRGFLLEAFELLSKT